MKSIDNEIDRILDEFLAGNITSEELKKRHARLQHLCQEQDSEQQLDTIQLPEELFYPTPPKNQTLVQGEVLEPLPAHFRLLPMAIIAVVMGILLVVGYYSLLYSYSDIAYRQFERYPIRIDRKLPNPLQIKWNAARSYYENGNYRSTIDNLQIILNRQPKDDYIDNFYIGLAYLANHQAREAIPYLENSLQTQPKDWQSFTHWYLGLAYLGNEQIDQANLHLEKVAISDSDLKKQAAQNLLEQLK